MISHYYPPRPDGQPLRISAVIPCYNSEAYLGQAIESALAQSRPLHEIIVVDDGSTDGTCAVAARYPVRLLRTGANSGPSVARNVGIAAASGDVIAFLDADDWWLPGHCEIVGGLLDRFPEAGAAAGAARYVGTRAGSFVPHCEPGRPQRLFWQALRYCPFPQMASMVRRELLLEVGGYDPRHRYAQDFDLWMRLGLRALFVCTHTVTVCYRWHEGQASSTPLNQLRAMFTSRQFLYQDLVTRGKSRIARRVKREIWLRWAIEALQAWRAHDPAWMATVRDVRVNVPPLPWPARAIGRGAMRVYGAIPAARARARRRGPLGR